MLLDEFADLLVRIVILVVLPMRFFGHGRNLSKVFLQRPATIRMNIEPANEIRWFLISKQNQSIVSGIDLKNLPGHLHGQMFVDRYEVRQFQLAVGNGFEDVLATRLQPIQLMAFQNQSHLGMYA